jgi:hypothetical protein
MGIACGCKRSFGRKRLAFGRATNAIRPAALATTAAARNALAMPSDAAGPAIAPVAVAAMVPKTAIQPASAASGTRTSPTRAGRRKRATASSATLPAAQAHRPARRPDPRIRTRSLTGDQSPYPSTGPFRHGPLRYAPIVFHARISDRPGRRQLLTRRFRSSPDSLGEPNARVSNPPIHRGWLSF